MINLLNNIDVNKVLPPNLIVRSAGTDLYRIGLSLYPIENVKRSLFYNPILIFVLMIYFFIKHLILLLIPKQSHEIYIIIGDLGYIFGAKMITNILIIFGVILIILSQLLNYNKWYKSD